MTNQSTLTMLAIGALLSFGAPAGADPLRCEGNKMRIEARYYECCSRCDRRERAPECDDTCKQRRDDGLDRVLGSRVCGDDKRKPTLPDPMLCSARLLRAGADSMFCESRCERRAAHSEEFDAAECQQVCETEHDTAIDEICDSRICSTFDGDECMETE